MYLRISIQLVAGVSIGLAAGNESCTWYCRHQAPALVQAILQAPGPGVGAGNIAATWPQHWCRRYCSHLAPVLVQALLQAPGPGVGAGVIAGNLHAAMMYLPFMQPNLLRVVHAAGRLSQGYMRVPV